MAVLPGTKEIAGEGVGLGGQGRAVKGREEWGVARSDGNGWQGEQKVKGRK